MEMAGCLVPSCRRYFVSLLCSCYYIPFCLVDKGHRKVRLHSKCSAPLSKPLLWWCTLIDRYSYNIIWFVTCSLSIETEQDICSCPILTAAAAASSNNCNFALPSCFKHWQSLRRAKSDLCPPAKICSFDCCNKWNSMLFYWTAHRPLVGGGGVTVLVIVGGGH